MKVFNYLLGIIATLLALPFVLTFICLSWCLGFPVTTKHNVVIDGYRFRRVRKYRWFWKIQDEMEAK
jgi:hypothetical protein